MNEMTTYQQKIPASVLNKFLQTGDVISFTDEQKLLIMQMLCEKYGLDPVTRPLDLIKMPQSNNTPAREIVYLTANGCELIAAKWKMSFKIKEKGIDKDAGVAYFVLEGRIPETDRSDESTAYVQCVRKNIKNEPEYFFGTDMANALMKCETKARRRLIKRLTGLDYIDEDDITRDDKKELDTQAKKNALSDAMNGIKNDTIDVEAAKEPEEEIELYDKTRPSHKIILKDVCVNAGLSLKDDIEFIKQIQDRLIEDKVNINDPNRFSEIVNQMIQARKESLESNANGVTN